ncbi:MAG: hypothetical protein JO352_14735, partial [Chloroflexi bacterium]|nr:hypothetical protein [Chloroflexota bacterium]
GLVALGAYWLAYQGSLAVRFPPREIGVASALRGNAALAGASFIAPDLSPVVWYYTRGRAVSADSGPLPEPTFLVCARGPAEPPAPLACDGWTTQLHGLGYPIDPGQNPIEAPDYLIYALPPCASLHVPASAAGSACAPMAAAPPTLAPLSAAPDDSRVDLKVTLEAAGSLAHVDYTYAQAAGTPEAGSVVRLYVLQTDGNWCLLDETAGSHDIRFPAASAGDFRASVIPRSSLAAGQQYFTAAVDLPPAYIFDLPDTRNGGVQHISAYSLEAAEQQAIAAGTWNPSAGTLGQDARTTLVDKPTADNVCRGQIR